MDKRNIGTLVGALATTAVVAFSMQEVDGYQVQNIGKSTQTESYQDQSSNSSAQVEYVDIGDPLVVLGSRDKIHMSPVAIYFREGTLKQR